MNLKDMSLEELENMSYDDIAYELLNENKKQMKIIDLFNEIGKLINLSQAVIEDKIGDFFEMLTLDKRFIMLDDGSWDLRSRHVQKIVIDNDEDEDIVEETEEVEESDDNTDFYNEDQDDDDTDDDLKDLVVIDEDEEESML